MEIYNYICLSALLLLSAGALLTDIMQWRVLNFWVYGWLAAGFVYEFVFFGGKNVPDRLLGAAIPVLLLGWLFCLRLIGAGDIKLFAAAGVWLGSGGILMCMFFSFAAGAAAAVFSMIKNKDGKKRFGIFIKYAAGAVRTKTSSEAYMKNAGKARVHVSALLFAGVLMKIAGLY